MNNELIIFNKIQNLKAVFATYGCCHPCLSSGGARSIPKLKLFSDLKTLLEGRVRRIHFQKIFMRLYV